MFVYYLLAFLSLFGVLLKCGCNFCADTGELYSFGCNDEGQLGCDSGSEERVDVPTKITLPTEKRSIRMLSAGVYHSACLTGLMLFCCILDYPIALMCIILIVLFSVTCYKYLM